MELPTNAEIFAKIPGLKNSNRVQVEEIRKWVFEKTQVLQDSITTYIEKSDYKADPEITYQRLQRYQLLCGGMLGLVAGLYERAYYLHFQELTESSRTTVSGDTKTKLNAGDRDAYAKGEVSDIKALKTLLDEVLKNLDGRLFECRSSNRKW